MTVRLTDWCFCSIIFLHSLAGSVGPVRLGFAFPLQPVFPLEGASLTQYALNLSRWNTHTFIAFLVVDYSLTENLFDLFKTNLIYLGCFRRTATHIMKSAIRNSLWHSIFPLFSFPNLSGSLSADLFHIGSVNSLDSGSDISQSCKRWHYTKTNLNEKTLTVWDFNFE